MKAPPSPRPYCIGSRSGATGIDAGLGLVHADTIVATTDDELSVTPKSAQIELHAAGRTTCGAVAELGLGPGTHQCRLRVVLGDQVLADKEVRLLLVEPSCPCRRFGARYGSLEYELPVIVGGEHETAPWESLWKTNDVADIVVDFAAPYKFILWRGMSFAPSWAMNNVLTANFFAETVEPRVYRDCCEIMSDRECRFVHARIVHTSDVRVVLHWRYALCDSAYAICRDQWADEMFYVYPDGVAARTVTVYLDPHDETAWQECARTGRRVPCSMFDSPPGKRTFNNMEFITVNAPGATSADNTPLDALTIMDTGQVSQTYRWPRPPSLRGDSMPELDDYIFRMNYRRRLATFVASPGAGMQIGLESNSGAIRYVAGARVDDDRWERAQELPSDFYDCIHWPVTRGCGTTPLTDPALYEDRPTHTFLGYAYNAPVEVRPDGAVTWSWLSGIAPEDEGELRARVKAWTAPCALQGARYDPRQRAYVVEPPAPRVELSPATPRPLVSPTFVLPGCEAAQVRVCADGHAIDEADLAVGVERSLNSTRTVIGVRGALPPFETLSIEVQ